MSDISQTKLNELATLARSSTPGPWKAINGTIFISHGDDLEYPIAMQYATCRTLQGNDIYCKDAQYITAACNIVPDLIAEITNLRNQLDDQEPQSKGTLAVIVHGTLGNGFTITGPFATSEEAAEEADENKNINTTPWEIFTITPP